MMQVLVVSKDPLARRALADMVGGLAAGKVAGMVDPGEVAARLAESGRPDLVLWEPAWESADFHELSDIAGLGLDVVALVTTREQALRARASGARGVLPRGTDVAVLAAAVAAVLEGLAVSDPSLEPSPHEKPTEDDRSASLTPRELEVLSLVAEGLPNKSIASRLGIRESTVKDHVNSLLAKLGAESRTEAVMLALRRGLIAI